MSSLLIILWCLAWSDEIYIDQGTIGTSSPIAVSYGTDSICLIWRKSYPEWYISGAFYNGSTWSSPEFLVPDSIFDGIYFGSPGLTVDSSNNIWIAWYYGNHLPKQKTNESYHGIYTKIYDGIEWQAPAYAETSMTWELTMCTAKGGGVFLCWGEDAFLGIWGFESIYLDYYEDGSWTNLLPVAEAHGHISRPYWDYSSPCVAADTANSIFISYHEYYSGTAYADYTVIIKQFKGDSLIEIGRKEEGNNRSPEIAIDSKNRLWLTWISDRDGDTAIYSSCYQDSIWLWDKRVSSGLEWHWRKHLSMMCDDNDMAWIAWSSVSDFSIWAAYYDGNWHPERVSKDSSAYHRYPCIVMGPQDKLWIFWEKSKGDTSIICGAWRELIGVEEDKNCQFQKPTLTVYPNPFTKTTTISFFSDRGTKHGHVSLRIYNLSGRLIKTFNHLTNQPFNQVTWNATDYPAGIYFVKFSAGSFTQTQKFILMR